ncbi:MAG TPA: hypothetical protein VK698_07995 [Kofleriaceae bacterium]|nr:hypothetical protein [Kofleriaceae bacterium]
MGGCSGPVTVAIASRLALGGLVLALGLVGCDPGPPATSPSTGTAAGAARATASPAPAGGSPAGSADASSIAGPDPASALADRSAAAGGARAISRRETPNGFGVGPGAVYYCDGILHAAPKTGGAERELGACTAAFDFQAGPRGVYFCDRRGLRLLPPDGPAQLVAADRGCILEAVDAGGAYYVVPGFKGVARPGLYRLAGSGGAPRRILATRRGEQLSIALDGDAIWIGHWKAGVISRMRRTGGPAIAVVRGQRGVVDVAVDDESIYWYAEGTGEIRRRGKRGGPIEVIGRDVDQEPIEVHRGHAYWFEGGPGKPRRLVHLAPGASRAEPLVDGLQVPILRIDDEGIYYAEFLRPGIFALPPPPWTSPPPSQPATSARPAP